MSESELPEFRKMPLKVVNQFVLSAFNQNGSQFVRLIPYEDNHFRVIFKAGYFNLAEDAEEPSKSQWGTLKKKLKRRQKELFIFRDSGRVDCGEQDDCYYLDFGFFKY